VSSRLKHRRPLAHYLAAGADLKQSYNTMPPKRCAPCRGALTSTRKCSAPSAASRSAGDPLTIGRGTRFRAAFWAGLPEHRKQAIVDLDWHSLRHFCGWYFYVHLGHSDELTAFQLGHSDAKLIRDLYGHGRADALERLKRASRVEIRPIRATPLPQAAAEGA
jgi:hypothetical protein